MRTTTKLAVGAAGATATALIIRSALRSPLVRFARMAGSSIAAPDAAGWVTDFLNAAYYQRPPELRSVDDLRLAFAIITTQWHRGGHTRLRAWDVLPFHRAFGRERFWDTHASERGKLNREQLLHGASQLLGAWFPDAYADDARRAWGIAFETLEERAAYQPEIRLQDAALEPLTPPVDSARHQHWHTYDPVPVPNAAAVMDALLRPETWPDYASEVGSFTPVRQMGLAGQTFEIEVVAQPIGETPLFTRGYVTVTQLVTPDNPNQLHQYMEDLNATVDRYGRDESQPLPDGATPSLGLDLTTHEGHFMGQAKSRLLLYTHNEQAYLRAVGMWDALPWYLNVAYQQAGEYAQQAFWGMHTPEESMLHQIALQVQRRSDDGNAVQ